MAEDDFADAEDRTLFIANAFREMDAHVIKLSYDGEMSRVVEALLRVATSAQACLPFCTCLSSRSRGE